MNDLTAPGLREVNYASYLAQSGVPESPAPAPREQSLALLNHSAIRTHAIKVSMESRQGKFTRVSSEFIADSEARIEAKLVELRRACTSRVDTLVKPNPDANFLTARGKKLILAAFNSFVAEEIHRQTKSINNGKTF